MKYQFIAGSYYGIVEAENEDQAREKLREKPELARVINIILKKITEANAHLIAAAPELLEEHKQWAKILGHIIVQALQGDYEALGTYAKCIPISLVNGEPWAKSEAIAKAEEQCL